MSAGEDTTQAEILLAQMAAATRGPEPAEQAAARRARVIGALSELHQRILEQRCRRRARNRLFCWAAAAIVPMVVAVGVYASMLRSRASTAQLSAHPSPALELVSGAVLLIREGPPDALSAPARIPLASGAELLTDARQEAGIVTGSGACIALAGATRVRFEAARSAERERETVELDQGSIGVHVPTLQPGRRFRVRTPDSSLEVRGTRFSVSVMPHHAYATLFTRVSVQEGRVLLRHDEIELLLEAGDSWPPEEEPVAAIAGGRRDSPAARDPHSPSAVGSTMQPAHDPASDMVEAGAAAASTPATPTAQSLGGRGRAGAAPDRAHAGASLLALQNRLLQEALQARRSGEDAAALALLNELLARFPSSPLAQQARVERFRALKRQGDVRGAARAARRYLAEHPGGFAVEEARGLALEPVPASSSQRAP